MKELVKGHTAELGFGKASLMWLLVLVIMVGLCCGCSSNTTSYSTNSATSSAQTPKSQPSTSSTKTPKSQSTPTEKTKPQNNYNNRTVPSVRTYADSRWPTFNDSLLAIPEQNRWYNAWSSAGTNCTIAGPVVNVYQATGSAGMPIFIDIGSAYPNPDSVTLLVWGDQYYEFAEMINAVDHGNAWLSVTGYLGTYDGYLQFDAGEGYIEYTWWTNVK